MWIWSLGFSQNVNVLILLLSLLCFIFVFCLLLLSFITSCADLLENAKEDVAVFILYIVSVWIQSINKLKIQFLYIASNNHLIHLQRYVQKKVKEIVCKDKMFKHISCMCAGCLSKYNWWLLGFYGLQRLLEGTFWCCDCTSQ